MMRCLANLEASLTLNRNPIPEVERRRSIWLEVFVNPASVIETPRTEIPRDWKFIPDPPPPPARSSPIPLAEDKSRRCYIYDGNCSTRARDERVHEHAFTYTRDAFLLCYKKAINNSFLKDDWKLLSLNNMTGSAGALHKPSLKRLSV